MSVVTIDQYRRQTGDITTSDDDAASAIAEAQEMVEDFLCRPLELMERTEVCEIAQSGFVYPVATPIDSVSVPTDTQIIDGQYITTQGDDYPDPSGFQAWEDRRYMPSHRTPRTSITYVGGWTSDTLPATLRRAICDLIGALTAPQSAMVSGASSVSLGDASISFGTSAPVKELDTLVPGITLRIQGYRRR